MIAARVWRVFWNALTAAQRRRFVLLQFVSVFMAASTAVGLAAVAPFFAELAEPGLMEKHAALRGLQQLLGIATRQQMLLALGGAFVLLLLFGALVNLAGTYLSGRFAYAVGDRVRGLLFAGYLELDYLFHVRHGPARLMDNVLYQSDRVPITLFNAQALITNVLLVMLVVASIAFVNPVVAAVGVLSVAGSYAFFYFGVRARVSRNGEQQSRLGPARIATLEEAFLGIKYLKIARAQPVYARRFEAVTLALSNALADTQFIAQFPRYVLECVAGTALIACAAFGGAGAEGAAWLAQLSFIGFAAFRLLPAFQQMYNAFIVVRNNRPALETLASQLEAMRRPHSTDARRHDAHPVVFAREIALHAASFRYSAGAPWVLDAATLRIEAGSAVGIVGASGCGKTTLVDLVLGLLAPAQGRLEVDGQPLDGGRLAAWQQCVGYVPQGALILDKSVRENIAFGIEPGEIDDARVREAAARAGAGVFIGELPGGYDTTISGTSLSGGQRQRIAIARALYRRPALLVLDEATNELDAETERAIIDALVRNRGARTLIVVAHTAAMVGACDRIVELRNGALHERRHLANASGGAAACGG